MSRKEELEKILDKLDEDKRSVLTPLLDDICFIENRLDELRKLPHIRVHPKFKSRQEITPAGKQYKEMLQTYNNSIKVIISALNKVETSAADELFEKLKEFEL
jgi:hypothetical protein